MNRKVIREDHHLLARIDKMVEELQLLRRDVAELLIAQADCEARAASCEASVMTLGQLYNQDFATTAMNSCKEEPSEFIPPEGLMKESISIKDLPVTAEPSIDVPIVTPHDGDEDRDDVNPAAEPQSDDTALISESSDLINKESDVVQENKNAYHDLFEQVGSHEAINDIFIPLNDDQVLDSDFEKQLSFSVVHRFSLADRYLFANELFGGDQSLLDEILTEIEKLSSWTQVESYLYDVHHLKKDDEVVKEFVSIIRDSAK